MAGIYRIEQPTLCMVMGVPASGKSTLAEGLVEKIIDACYISKDMPQEEYTTERVNGFTYALVRGPTFRFLVKDAGKHLQLGKFPVVDAPFSVNGGRDDEYSDFITPFRREAEANNARLAVIRCVPPSEEELRIRIEKRGYERDKWKIANWEEFLRQEPINFVIPHSDVIDVVSDCSTDEMIAKALVYLNVVRV